MKPTRRGFISMAVVILLWSVSIFFSQEFLYETSLLISGAIVFSAILLTSNDRSLFLMLFIQQRQVRRMDSISVEYILSNKSFIPIFSAHVEILLMKELGLDVSEEGLYAFNPYEIKSIKRNVTCKKRGFYTIGALRVCLQDPIGLFKVVRHIERNTEVTVLPGIIHTELLDREYRSEGMRPMNERLPASQPTELERIRTYSQWDPMKKVHWKASARYQELKVKEFKETGLESIQIVFMGDENTKTVLTESQQEVLIDLATSMAMNHLELGMRVDMVYIGCAMARYTYLNPESASLVLEHGAAFEYGGGSSMVQLERSEAVIWDNTKIVMIGVRPDAHMISEIEAQFFGRPTSHVFIDDSGLPRIVNRNELSD